MYTDWCKSCAGSEKNLIECMQPRRLTLLSVCGPIQRKQQTCPSSTAVLIWLVHVFVSILTGSPNTTFCLNSRLPEDKHKKQFERQPEEVT
jgi:hypothetical protein